MNGNPYFCQTLGRSNHSYFIYTGHSHILTSHCTAGHAAWERGCKHFLPNEWPADSALTSLPFPPWGGTCHSSRLCGRQFQPQGYVISVHHSQQCSSHSGSAHKNTTSLANHFSCRDVLAKQDEKKKLYKIVFGFPAALKSCLSLFHVQSQEAYVRSPQTQKCLVAAFPGKSFSKNNQHTTHKVIQGVTVESGKYIRMLEPRDLCQSVFCQIVSCPSASSRPDLCDTSWAGVVTACCWTVSQRVKG